MSWSPYNNITRGEPSFSHTWSAVLHTYTWPLYRFASNLHRVIVLFVPVEACISVPRHQTTKNLHKGQQRLTMALWGAVLLL